jgi:periodic tryptophan protein 2
MLNKVCLFFFFKLPLQVKVWKTIDGFCFITFTAHVGQVTGVAFSQKGQVVVSASRDGTVRAFDLNK